MTMVQLREKSKDRGILRGRKVFNLVARAYGYKGREMARYIQKSPAVITRYLQEKSSLADEVEKVECLKKRANLNKHV